MGGLGSRSHAGAGRRAWLALAIASVVALPARAEPVDPWQDYVAEASRRFAVPQSWIRRVIHAESRGRTMRGGRPIRSRVGAIGMMQLMPGTWAAMRDRFGLGTDPDLARDNILAGTAYLRLMYDRFGYPGLFAAYNAGPGRYAGYLATGRPLPAETLSYVERVAGGTFHTDGSAPPPADGLFFRLGMRSDVDMSDAPQPPSPILFAVMPR
ncbi:lytic transglycosylase domain-containing protein [Flavisphingomonas formosensis]|uniref:lytic transglycosylase domain-containing protein n=1 Tax=Flavisphingomonas formosensis TaxID=861534 RepID=UPI0012FC3931|nr:lytic transglycosylase domain-containing protein [Sphingomonas formosensis]